MNANTNIFLIPTLMSAAVNMDRFNPHKQKVFGVLSNFYWCEEVLRPKCVEKLCYTAMRVSKLPFASDVGESHT